MYRRFIVASIFLILAITIVGGCEAATTSSTRVLSNGTLKATANQNSMGNASTASSLGDLNGDGIVDLRDLVILAQAFGSVPGDPNWNSRADCNKDGIVNEADLAIVARNFGKSVKSTPLTFEKMMANTVVAGKPVQLTCAVNGNTNVSSYIYSWNNTGTWQNQTALTFSNFVNSTEANATFVGTWESVKGDTVAVIVYANNTEDDWVQSSQYNFTLIELPTSTTSSGNWAGVVTVSNIQNPEPTLVEVSASWVVPTVASSLGTSYSAIWIGIGGFSGSDRTLIQTGTEQDSIWGQTTYSAWYELLPDPAITISLNVNSGDQMNASILLTNSSANQWLISITDLTSGQNYEKQVVYASSQQSAEWIVERPTIGGRIGSLADFGNVTFTNCEVTLQSTTGTIGDFPNIAVAMDQTLARGYGSTVLAGVSNFNDDGSSFSVTEQ